MEFINWRSCGRLFNYIGGTQLCGSCKDKLEVKFQHVKEYLWDNPKANMKEIAVENDVTTNQLRQWIREERLQLAPDSPILLACENCGKNIYTGRFCQECKNKLARGLSDEPKQKEQPKKKSYSKKEEDRMRFLK